MHGTGTRISGERTSIRALVPALLMLLLLTGGLPCGSLSGCSCPCPPKDRPSNHVEAPGSCCETPADATLTPALPARPQHPLAAPAVLPAASQDLAPTLLPPGAPRLSCTEADSCDPPPLIFLLCILLI